MDAQQEMEHRRETAVKEAINAVDDIILGATLGSTEETNWMTGRIAEELTKKAMIPYSAALMKMDLGL